MRLERHPAVIKDDLPNLYSHIARDNPRAAERLLDAIAATFAQIVNHPECGMVYPAKNPRLKAVRMLPVSGFPNYQVEGTDNLLMKKGKAGICLNPD